MDDSAIALPEVSNGSSCGVAADAPLIIVMNDAAGHADVQAAHETIRRIFSEAGRPQEFVLLDDPARLAEIAERAVKLALARNGIVVAVGGDGTINGVAQAVLAAGCPFGVLPQGTFNYFGRAHGIPQETEAAARSLLGAVVREVQAGRVNDRVFLVNASVGLYPKLLEDRERMKQQFGRSRLVAMAAGLLTLLRDRKMQRLDIEFDGIKRFVVTPTLFVGNNALQLDRLGFREAAALERGRLAAVVMRPAGLFSMLALILRGALGRLGEAETVDSFAFKRLKVSSRRKGPIKIATDGEIHWMRSPLVFEVAAEPLRLMVPRVEDRVEVA